MRFESLPPALTTVCVGLTPLNTSVFTYKQETTIFSLAAHRGTETSASAAVTVGATQRRRRASQLETAPSSDPTVPLVWSPNGLSCAGARPRPKSGCQVLHWRPWGRICFQARSACWQNELLCSGGNEVRLSGGNHDAAGEHPPSLSQPPPPPH